MNALLIWHRQHEHGIQMSVLHNPRQENAWMVNTEKCTDSPGYGSDFWFRSIIKSGSLFSHLVIIIVSVDHRSRVFCIVRFNSLSHWSMMTSVNYSCHHLTSTLTGGFILLKTSNYSYKLSPEKCLIPIKTNFSHQTLFIPSFIKLNVCFK